MPGRAPDQDAAGEQLPGLEAMHARPSVEGEARPGRLHAGRRLRSMPSTITAFMPKVRAPSTRGSARYWASTSPTRVAGHAGRRVDVGNRAARAGLDQLQPHRALGACRSAISSRWSSPCASSPSSTMLGRKRAIVTAGSPAARQAPVQLVERGGRRHQQRKAVLERVLGLERRRSSAGRPGAAAPDRSAPGAAAGRGSR